MGQLFHARLESRGGDDHQQRPGCRAHVRPATRNPPRQEHKRSGWSRVGAATKLEIVCALENVAPAIYLLEGVQRSSALRHILEFQKGVRPESVLADGFERYERASGCAQGPAF